MIFLDTNVISETLRKTPVIAWLVRNDAELALPTVIIAEIAFGIGKIPPDQRAARLEQGLAAWRHRFADRVFPFTEAAALAYGDIMSAALRQGRPMTAPDGMIEAIAHLNGHHQHALTLRSDPAQPGRVSKHALRLLQRILPQASRPIPPPS